VLTIDTMECRLTVTMPYRHGGVASMVATLREVGIQVIRIEPWGGNTGVYQLSVNDRHRLAMSVLERIGCQALGASNGTVEAPLTPRTDEYAMYESKLTD